MSMTLPGIATGMDTSALIDQLMDIERIPQQQLMRRVATTNQYTDALRELNTRVSTLGTTATEASRPAALQQNTASSSSDAVQVSAGSSAQPGSLNFTVDSVAARHTMVTDAVSAFDTANFEIVAADGSVTSIEAASTDLNDIIAAINGSDAGVSATRVRVGDGTYRLQLAAQETGADSSFTLNGSAVGTSVTSAGADAEVVLWSGTAAEQRITSATNTFNDLLDGVDVTVTAATSAPVTISVERDEAAAVATAAGLIESVQSVLRFLDRATAVDTEGDQVSGSVLTGDSTARTVRSRVHAAVTTPIEGQSLSAIGIEITRNGEITFDEEKFAAALNEDPARVEELFATLAGRIASTSDGLSDRYDGFITSRITGQESNIRRMEEHITQWDGRLDRRRATLERTYAQLEVTIQRMNSQMEYLTSQLAQLPQMRSTNQ